MSTAPAKKRKPIILVVLILVILAVLFGVKMYFESKIVKAAKEELTLLEPYVTIKAEGVSASILSRSITYKDVTLSVQDMDEGALKIGSVTQSGVDWDTLLGNPGDLSTYDSLVCSDMRLMAGAMQIMTIPVYEVKGATIPYRDLKAGILRLKADDATEEDLMAIMPHLTKIKMDSVKATDIGMNFMVGTASIGSIEGKDYVFGKSYGPASVNNIKVQMMGEELGSLEKMGCDGVLFPTFFSDFLANPAEMMERMADGTMEEDPFSVITPFEISNLHMRGLKIGGPSPMSINELYGDLKLYKDKKSSISYGFKGFEVSKELLRSSREFGPVASLITQPLMLNLDVQGFLNPADMTEMGGSVGFSDANLGSVNASLDMVGPKDMIANFDVNLSDKDVLFKSFEFNVEGKGMVDLLLAFVASSENMRSYSEARDMVIENIESSLMNAEPFQEELLLSVKKLVENGGSLNFSLKPEKPFSLADIDTGEEFDPKAYGASVTYTPPKN